MCVCVCPSHTFDGLWSVQAPEPCEEVLVHGTRAVSGHSAVEVRLVPLEHVTEGELGGRGRGVV